MKKAILLLILLIAFSLNAFGVSELSNAFVPSNYNQTAQDFYPAEFLTILFMQELGIEKIGFETQVNGSPEPRTHYLATYENGKIIQIEDYARDQEVGIDIWRYMLIEYENNKIRTIKFAEDDIEYVYKKYQFTYEGDNVVEFEQFFPSGDEWQGRSKQIYGYENGKLNSYDGYHYSIDENAYMHSNRTTFTYQNSNLTMAVFEGYDNYQTNSWQPWDKFSYVFEGDFLVERKAQHWIPYLSDWRFTIKQNFSYFMHNMGRFPVDVNYYDWLNDDWNQFAQLSCVLNGQGKPASISEYGYQNGNTEPAGMFAFTYTNVDSNDEVNELNASNLTAYPNPFNPSTTVSFKLKTKQYVSLDVYNIKGQKVANLYKGMAEAKTHNIKWQGTDTKGNKVPSGVYFYRLQNAQGGSTKKFLLLK